MRTVSPQEYAQRVKEVSPPSPVVKDCGLAFLSGGAICTLGQVLCQCYQNLGLALPDARIAVSISLIFMSAALTALGWYDDLAKHAGAGVLVPITGFANSMVSPAMEFKSDESVIIGPSQESSAFLGEYGGLVQDPGNRKENKSDLL